MTKLDWFLFVVCVLSWLFVIVLNLIDQEVLIAYRIFVWAVIGFTWGHVLSHD